MKPKKPKSKILHKVDGWAVKLARNRLYFHGEGPFFTTDKVYAEEVAGDHFSIIKVQRIIKEIK